MGLWAKVAGTIFGGSKTTDDIFDKDSGLLAKAGGWIGNQQFTEQEQAISNAATQKAWGDFVVATMSENTDRSKSRRDIAIFWIHCQLLFLFMAIMVYPFHEEWSAFIFSIALSNLMLTGSLGVLGFFFGPYMFGAHVKKKGDDN